MPTITAAGSSSDALWRNVSLLNPFSEFQNFSWIIQQQKVKMKKTNAFRIEKNKKKIIKL